MSAAESYRERERDMLKQRAVLDTIPTAGLSIEQAQSLGAAMFAFSKAATYYAAQARKAQAMELKLKEAA